LSNRCSGRLHSFPLRHHQTCSSLLVPGYLFHRYRNILAPDAVITVGFMIVIYAIINTGLLEKEIL